METSDNATEDGGEVPRRVMDAVERVLCAARSMGEDGVDGSLWGSVPDTAVFEDVVRVYSCILGYVTSHMCSIGQMRFGDLLVIEGFLLDKICRREVLDFNEIFEDRDDGRSREQRRALDTVRGYFPNSSININCEQEFESLMYKVYVGNRDTWGEMSVEDVGLLLTLLFRRGESMRFFKVFNQHRKTEWMFRLGLVMALRDDDTGMADRLLREMDRHKFPGEGSLPQDSVAMGFVETLDVMSHKDAREWVCDVRREMEWEECVHFWSSNRVESSEGLNKSMMDLCIKHGRYEEGWVVYSKGCRKTNYVVHKACILSLKALRERGDRTWVSRLFEIVDESYLGEDPDAMYLITNDILENLPVLPSHIGNVVLEGFIERMDMAKGDEDVVNLITGGLLKLCKKCEDNSQTCNLCVDYADKLYNKWRMQRGDGHRRGAGQNKIECEIYSNILGVFGSLKDKNRFIGVCRDLAGSNTKITKELSSRLQKLHVAEHTAPDTDPATMEQHVAWERLISLILQRH